MQIFFKNNNSDELILLLNGWGMDERPYKPLKSKRDILFVSDYNDLNLEFPSFAKYKKIILITFSAGAFMANYLKDKLPPFSLKIAISGNFHLFKKGYGAPDDILHAMKNISFENALEFRKNLVNEESEYILFNKNQPLRGLESSLAELKALENYSSENKIIDFEFDKIIIGTEDKFFPYKHQIQAWGQKSNVKAINGGHFLFYKFSNFDEIIDF